MYSSAAMTADQPHSQQDSSRLSDSQPGPTERDRPFRVHNHSRVLGLVVTGLLLLGFGVLRLLTGAGDTPHIETTSAVVTQPSASIDGDTDDQVYRLRPHASSVIPMTHSEPIPAPNQAWSPLSLEGEWPAAPQTLNEFEANAPREPELFR